MQQTYSHELTVARTFTDAINLFTPRGEEEWLPGWEPVYLSPASGQTEEGMVFTTGEGDETSFWTCLTWQPDDGHARYLCITPASRFAFIDVQCRPDGDARSRVTVRYEVQATTDAGEKWIATVTDEAFSKRIDRWSELIDGLRA